ncbi:MAG: DUF2207 domain-containing protein [Micropruina glycogenica]
MDLTWILLGVVVLALLVWAWRAQRRKFADEYFAGVTPGLTPVGAQTEQRVPVPGGAEYTGEVAVAFNPPKGVRPGLAGTVVDGKPETRDVIATIVDLAARGHLSIVVVENPRSRTGKDWELRKADKPTADRADPMEAQLLRDLFVGGPDVRLSELPRLGNSRGGRLPVRPGQRLVRGRLVSPRDRHAPGAHRVDRRRADATGGFRHGRAGAPAGRRSRRGGRRGDRFAGHATPRAHCRGTALRIQTLGFKRYLRDGREGAVQATKRRPRSSASTCPGRSSSEWRRTG